MLRLFALQIMFFVSLFTAWSVGYASQMDDCCSRIEESVSEHISEASHTVSVIQEHPDDCANRCVDCVICQTQCNQHGLLSALVPVFGFNLVQSHNSIFVHSYTDIESSVLKEPPRV